MADRIAGMFLDHADRRYFPRLIETCLQLINRYQQAGDLRRSDMWFRVLLALSSE